ncbi:F-box/kelch-repeat protein SKIP6 isoform X1 [Capsicum galapagoense]
MADVGPQSQLIPNLPDDIALQCLARIPRSHHPTLSLVSKSWRSTLTSSPTLYNTRSLIRTTETFLYLSLRINSTFHWYTLVSHKLLFPVCSMPVKPIGPAFAVLGSKIYVIGGSIGEIPSNNVWVFDCRFNCWEMGPRMRIGREFAAAGVANGKIYVMGGCVVDNWAKSMNWAEVFDPATGLWTALPSPIEVRDKWMHATAVVGARVYAMTDRGVVVYDVEGCQWGTVSKRLDLGWRGRAMVVGGVLYCYDYLGKIIGYDVKEDVWKELRGVDKGLPKYFCGATMVNFDDRLCVVWEGKGSGKEVDIMCAEIQVRRDEDGGLSGNILWSDMILVVPNGASIVQCLAVDL